MQYLMILKTVLTLVPVIINLIDLLDEIIPESGKGPSKLSLFKDMFQKIIDKTESITQSFESIWPVAEDIIAFIVAAKNKK